MQTWQIGDIKVTRIMELELTGGGSFILPDATPEALEPYEWMKPHFVSPEGELVMSVHALIVDTGDRRIIVDTCIGNDKERDVPAWTKLQGPFLDDIAKAGYARETIDTVMCTHLHVDHVGWNTMLVDGKWVPTFPNARYLMAQTEFDYWRDQDTDPSHRVVFSDSVQPVFDAGLVDLIDTEHEICEGVKLLPTFGHTPGHVSVHLSSKGEEALITGDFIHHPCQFARTDWCSSFDYDKVESKATRDSVFDRYADTGLLVIGTHFATPTAGHIKRDGDAFRLEI